MFNIKIAPIEDQEIPDLIEKYKKTMDTDIRVKLEKIGEVNRNYPFCRALYIASYDSYRIGITNDTYIEPLSEEIKKEVTDNREVFLNALNLRVMEYALTVPKDQFEFYDGPQESICNVFDLIRLVPDRSSLKPLAAFAYTSRAIRRQSIAQNLIRKIVDPDNTGFDCKTWWKKEKNVMFSAEELANFDKIIKKRSMLLKKSKTSQPSLSK